MSWPAVSAAWITVREAESIGTYVGTWESADVTPAHPQVSGGAVKWHLNPDEPITGSGREAAILVTGEDRHPQAAASLDEALRNSGFGGIVVTGTIIR